MVRNIRLAKEDYAYMGSSPVWLLDDAVHLLACFEMEQSGVFGGSDELVEIETLYSVTSPLSKVEAVYQEGSSRWHELLVMALWNGMILYENIPRRDDVPLDLPDGAGKTVTGTSSFVRDELLRFLVKIVRAGKLELDLGALHDFLCGKGAAPAKGVQVIKEAMNKEDMAAGLSSGRNAIPRSKVEKYVIAHLEEGCTCWHKLMAKRAYDHFVERELVDESIPAKEKVSKKFKESGVLRIVRETYSARGREDLIYDLSTHGGRRNNCRLHPDLS